VVVIAGTPQEAVRAGGDDRQPLAGLFIIAIIICLAPQM